MQTPFRDDDVPPEQDSGTADMTDSARARWMEQNDIHTEFLDAGIGCFWFAQQGENEPVSGETEDEALERLARENGLKLWDRFGQIVSRPRPAA